MNFTKMHGIGNDYIYVNCFEEHVDEPSSLAVVLSDRHLGIGGDGLILIEPCETADVRMRIFNADGSEAEMCGNGIRCVAKYVYDHGVIPPGGEFSVTGHETFEASLRIETLRGVLTVGIHTDENNEAVRMCVNMGRPVLTAADIPVNLNEESVIDVPINIMGQDLSMTCVSMGNPHAVFFCDHVWDINLERIGPLIENHELFPNRTNVHFVKVETPEEITMRTWERGSGITMACGTGACASAVAGVLSGKCSSRVLAHLPGGDLELFWLDDDECVYMTGPATEVFEGRWFG